jgi:hypothetical protein
MPDHHGPSVSLTQLPDKRLITVTFGAAQLKIAMSNGEIQPGLPGKLA